MDLTQLLLLGLGLVSLVNLVLVLRIIGQTQRNVDARARYERQEHAELASGQQAPAFRAFALNGRGVSDQSFGGQPVAYLFVSPNCSACHEHMATLAGLGPRLGDALIVLVTDVGPARGKDWLETLDYEDGVKVKQPMIAVPTTRTQMMTHYNPRGYFPYFVVVNADKTVRRRGVLTPAAWQSLLPAEQVTS
jgi:hypothetical protein